jgi:hypothetical protein
VRSIVAAETAKNNRTTIFLIMGIGLFLVALIGANFYLDYRRSGGGGATGEGAKGAVNDPHVHTGEFTTKL